MNDQVNSGDSDSQYTTVQELVYQAALSVGARNISRTWHSFVQIWSLSNLETMEVLKYVIGNARNLNIGALGT